MANRKINELSPRTPSLTDLIIVGDPSTGYSFKATISVLAAFAGSNIQFSSLQGISITSPTNGQALVYDGTNWTNQNISVPVTSVFGRTGVVVATEGDYSLDLLSDVTLTSPTTNQVLQYNGTAWVNATFVAGINSLNGLTATSQTFATGTSGTDFAISSTTSTHTFNLPTASAVNRGALSSADWSTFNAKQDALSLTTTGSSGSATLVGATLNVPTYTLAGLGGITLSSLSASAPLSYNNGTGAFSISQATTSTDGYLSSTDWNTFNNKQNALTNPVTGTGTTNYLPKWTGSTALGNSLVFDNGTNVGIGTASPNTYLAGVIGASIFSAGSVVGFSIASSSSNYLLQYLNGSGHYVWFAGPTAQRLGTVFSSTGNWNIGTITSDAGYRLDVSGTFRSTLDANINGLTVGKGGGSVATNTAVGVSALNANTTAYSNTAIGNSAMSSVQNGYQNTAIGADAMTSLVGGIANVAVGFRALQLNTSSYQTGLGWNALSSSTNGYNTGVGYRAGFNITTGTGNTILGYDTGLGITTGNNNTIIGANVSGLSSSLSNTIILADGQGNQRLYINSSGEAMIGSTTDQGDFKLQVTGQQVIQGVLTAGSPFPNFGYVGVLELKSSNQNALSVYGIKFNNTNTGSAFIGISADNASAYSRPNKSLIHKADGHVFYNSSDVNLFSIFPSTGNISVNSATDAGYKLDVNGTGRFRNALWMYSVNTADDIINFHTGSTYIKRPVSSTEFHIGNSLGSGIQFFTSAERMRITNGGNILIGTSTDVASAILNASSTTKGFLPPRMTNAQMVAIGTPASGLMVYDTTNNKLNVYDGTNWVAVH